MEQNPPQLYHLRPGLEFSPQQHQGKSFVVVKDPVTARYFRFTETQAVILDVLRDPIDARALAGGVAGRLGGAVPLATIEGFLKSLEDKWLLDTASIREKLSTVEGQKLRDRHNILYRKIASFNPEKIFDWLLPRTRWAFTKGFNIFGALSIITGLVMSTLHRAEFAASVQRLFNLHGLLFLWLVNFNPLIKLDGYYMLSDYLEIPNLRIKAIASVWNWVGGRDPSGKPWKEARAQFIYGIASIAFSTTLLIYVYSALYTWTTARFAFAGLVGFAMFSTYTLRRTAVESIAGLRAVPTRVAVRKYRNAGLGLEAVLG